MTPAARAALCSAVLAALPCWAWAATGSSSPADPHVGDVLQIVAYRKDAYDGRFTAQSAASAVVVAEGRLLTNAHAVLDEDGRPSDGFAACRAQGWDAEPTCDWTLRLERTDTGADLAILSAETPTDWGSGVTFATAAPALGDDVDVYGFPSNGGGTVTVTRGRVAGTDGDSGWLKTDAAIDAGNSGGAAFGTGGKLVGVPVAVRIGYSTLGYLIPASQASAFLRTDGPAAPRDAATADAFAQWRADLKRRKKSPNVVDNGLVVRKYADYGFELSDLDRALDGKISQYRFSTPDGNTEVSAAVSLTTGKIPGADAEGKARLKKVWKAVAGAKNARLGGRTFDEILVTAAPMADGAAAVTISLRTGNVRIFIQQEKADGPQLRQAVALAASMGAGTKDSGATKYGPVTFVVPTGGGAATGLDSRWNVMRSFYWPDGTVAIFSARDLGTAPEGTLKEFAFGMRKGLGAALDGDLTSLSVRSTHSGAPYVQAGLSNAQGRSGRAYVFLWTDAAGHAWAGVLTAASPRAGASLDAADRFASWTQVDAPAPFPAGGVEFGADLLAAPAAK